MSDEVNLNVPRKVQRELRWHLSNFVSDLDQIGKIIEGMKPHHGLVRRWRRLKFEMEGNVNDFLTLINREKTEKELTFAGGYAEKSEGA
jgi:hypothetical protein